MARLERCAVLAKQIERSLRVVSPLAESSNLRAEGGRFYAGSTKKRGRGERSASAGQSRARHRKCLEGA